jgi:Rod binding domain-containing protein
MTGLLGGAGAPAVGGDARDVLFGARGTAQDSGASDFSRALQATRARAGAGGSAGGQDKAREAAEEFVSVTFVQPLLKQLRESNHAAAPFAPTQGEKQFRSLADAEIARRIVKASRWGLVDRIASDIGQRSAAKGAAAASKGAAS